MNRREAWSKRASTSSAVPRIFSRNKIHPLKNPRLLFQDRTLPAHPSDQGQPQTTQGMLVVRTDRVAPSNRNFGLRVVVEIGDFRADQKSAEKKIIHRGRVMPKQRFRPYVKSAVKQ